MIRMAKQTTVRLPDELADEVDAVARAKGTSVNQLIIDSLTAEIDRVRDDKGFLATLKRLVDRDQEILDRLAQ
jgi:predicted DNA-binding protein